MRTASTSTRSLTGLSAAWTGILAAYGDWKDISQWPQVPGEDSAARRRLARQEDPTAKRGVIGAFCRTYSVTQAMERFIPGMYEETDIPGRYTYTGGSTAGGAIVYDEDRFLYSHHATDHAAAFWSTHSTWSGSINTGTWTGTPKRGRRSASCHPSWP